MNRLNKELAVGIFIIAGMASIFYISLAWAGFRSESNTYVVTARFVSASGLRPGAGVEIAGVVVGEVTRVDFDDKHYQAVVDLRLPQRVQIQEDAIASIRTTGVMGPKFIKISPGGSETILSEGDELYETESSISIEELVSKYIFDSGR